MASTTPRFVNGAGQDNTFRTVTRDYQTPAYASTLAINTSKEKTLVNVGQLTGAMTVTIGVTNCFIGDEIQFLFSVDGTNRTVTFDTGFAPSATLALTASKYGSATFVYNGAKWCEMGRAVTA